MDGTQVSRAVYKKEPRWSDLIENNESEFAAKVTAAVDENRLAYRTYRDKCKRNEEVWRNRHWNHKAYSEEEASKPKPNEPVLHSTVENCVADCLDQFPDAIIRGSLSGNDVRASIATEIVRFAMQRARYSIAYKKAVRAAYKIGTGSIDTFWNPEMDNGLGDIDYRYRHIDNVVWDKDAENAEEGRLMAVIEWPTPEEIYEMYPDIDLNACFPEDENAKDSDEMPDENVRDSKKEGLVRVINVRWRERVKRTVQIENEDGETETEELDSHQIYVHTARVIGNKVVDKRLWQYDHGRYGLHLLPFLEIDDEPVGLSLIDLFEDPANIINLIEQQYICNLQASAEDRWLVNRNARIDKQALLDYREKIIMGDVIHEGAARSFRPTPFSGQALNYKQAKRGQIKEDSGQLDVNIGQSAAGVTAASAIQALQEYGAKRSRLFVIWSCYEMHKEIVKDTLSLMKHHYTTERIFRISQEAKDAVEKLIEQAMKNIQVAAEQGLDMKKAAAMAQVLPEGVTIEGNKLIVDFSLFSLDFIDLDYDIEIIPQRKNAATSNLINSMVQQGMNSGIIPADVGFELMEWEGKETVMKKIRERFDVSKQLKETQQQLEQTTEQAQQLAGTVQQLQKETDTMERRYWAEKIKAALAMCRARGGEDGEGAEAAEDDGKTPEQILMEVFDEVSASTPQGDE